MDKVSAVKELNALLVGSNSSLKYLVGNIILGTKVFDQGDVKFCCERGEGEVCGRRVTLVKAPGWLRGYDPCNTPELLKTEAILSVRPGLHAFILVINAELPFKNTYKKATQKHLQHFFGDKVWDHTIVVFIHRGCLSHETIEDYIREEGAPLQSLLEACGNRYHFLWGDSTDNNEKIKELFEKIDAMVAEKSCYQIDSTLVQNAESNRRDVDKKAEQLFLQSQRQRTELRKLLTEPTPNLRILMVGWVFSGKSASGNSILRGERFQAGEKTEKALQQWGKVSGREVLIVDTPGWWKFFPASFTPSHLKSEILKGVSLSSPSPNVILLAVPLDTSFTEDQRRVTEDNMRLLGQTVWRHVIVLFTFGNALGDKTIEQHIESEGKPLRWLIEKCNHRYHVLDNMHAPEDQIIELLEKMEEMVAGNSCFYFSANPDAGDPQPQDDRSEISGENKDEAATEEITRQLTIEWDRNNWEKYHSSGSMTFLPPILSDGWLTSGASKLEEEQTEQQSEDDQVRTSFDAEVENEGGAESDPLRRWRILMEKEWNRREVVMEQTAWNYFYSHVCADTSEPDSILLQKSREKVRKWLETKETSSGYGTSSFVSCKSVDKED